MVPVVRELAGRGIRVSVDTMRAATALAAVEAGAEIINDVSAGLADAAMAPIVAETACTTSPCTGAGTPTGWTPSPSTATSPRRCATSWRPASTRSSRPASWHERLILDPGLGFAKRGAQNWELLGRLDVLGEPGRSWWAPRASGSWAHCCLDDATMEERDLPTAVVSALSAQAGAGRARARRARHAARARRPRAWQSGRRG